MRTVDCRLINYTDEETVETTLRFQLGLGTDRSDWIIRHKDEIGDIVFTNYKYNSDLESWIIYLKNKGFKIEKQKGAKLKVPEILEHIDRLSEEEFNELIKNLLPRI